MQTSWGVRGILPREILKLGSSEIAGNVYFLFIFVFSKFARRAVKLHQKGHFPRVFEKRRARAPCFPSGSYVHVLDYDLKFKHYKGIELARTYQEYVALLH